MFNNTFDGNPYGITGGDNLIAVNNIISNSSVLGLKNIDASSMVAYTLFFGNAADHAGSNVDAATTVRADPLYTGSFTLQPSSPAIDSGTTSFSHNGQTVLSIPPSEYTGASADLGGVNSSCEFARLTRKPLRRFRVTTPESFTAARELSAT